MGTAAAAQTVRDIIEASRYLVLATADAAGRPWSTPVYFAHIGFTDFFWVSSPDVTHSRNVAVRPEVGIAVFDSQAAIGTGQGVYMSAVATMLQGGETARGRRRDRNGTFVTPATPVPDRKAWMPRSCTPGDIREASTSYVGTLAGIMSHGSALEALQHQGRRREPVLSVQDRLRLTGNHNL